MPFLLAPICFLLAAFLQAKTGQIKPVAVTVAGNNVDSLAIWIAPKKEESLVMLTEKGSGQVMVFKADRAATFVTRFGKMKRPNGVAVLQGAVIGSIRRDLAFVTDRDGDLIYAYSLPDFALLGTFGAEIKQPMGISIYRRNDGAVFAFVVAKRATGDDKVTRFRIAEEQGRIVGRRELQFGRELSAGQETVTVDAGRELVYVADENEREIKVYNLDGKWQRNFGRGVFEAQVEGIAIVACGAGGYIIASDQKDVTEFEIFDRTTFKHLGTVRGAAHHTDGIALTLTTLPDYPRGLFMAQSDPESTGGRHAEFYDLGALLGSIGLRWPKESSCLLAGAS